MKLYEIDARLLECYQEVDEETGEFLNIQEIEHLELERENKLESIALWIKNTTAEKEAVKAEKMNLADRQKKLERKIESLKAYLQFALNGEKLTTGKVKVSYRTTGSVNVTDISKLPEEYLKYAEPTADKTAIKKAINEGVEIAGAELVENTSMIIK